MAETYKGLTIRIGGDATSLQKALRSVNSSISTTEGQLRKMKQALKMDPENTDAIATNLQLVGQRAVEAQSRLNQLKSALKEVGNQKVELFSGTTSQTVRELASQTENAAARAADAKRNYAEVVEQLARVKSQIKELTGIDLDDELNPDETVETMRELGMVSDQIADKYKSLRSSFEGAFNENEIAKAVAKMADLEVETTKTSAEAKSLAQRFAELSREASSMDFGEGIDTRLKMVDAAASDVTDELNRLNKALKLDPDNVELLALKIRDMSESSSLADEKIELLSKKLKSMNAAGIGKLSDETNDVALAAREAADEYDKASVAVTELKGKISSLSSEMSLLDSKDLSATDEYKKLQTEIEQANVELKQLVATQQSARSAFDTAEQVSEYRKLQTEISETEAKQSSLNNEMQEMSRFSGITQSSLVSLGMSLSTTVTPAVAAVGYTMVDSADTIDSAYRDMRKTVNGTEEDFEDLREAAAEFSTTHFTSADQILSIQAIGGELGVATEDLKTFAETVSNLDIATNLNSEEAAQTLGQLSNILSDLTSDKFPNFSDALVRLGNNGASTEDKIADVATRIGSMASIANFTTPEILAWSSTIASTGQGAESAGTAISRTISDIETAVANGGDSLQAFADIAGMSAEQFASAWESTPSDVLKAFIEGLVNVEDSGNSAITTLDNLGITSVRQVQAIQGLMQMIGGLDDNLRMSEDAWNGVSDEWGDAGDAAREADRKAEGFSGSLQRLENIAQVTASELGESLVPVIDGVADFLGNLYDMFKELPDGAKQAIVAVGAFAGALGPLMLLSKGIGEFFGGLTDGLQSLSDFTSAAKKVDSLSTAFDTASGAASSLSGVLKGGLVAVGIVAAVGGVAALVSAFMDEAEKAEEAQRATEGLSDSCKLATDAIDANEYAAREASESTESFADSLTELREKNDETRSSLADLADEFDELNERTYAQVHQLSDAYAAVRNYNGEADVTAQQVGELKSAIDAINDICGTNYEVVRDASGAYYVMQDGAQVATQAIYDLIEAQQKQLVIDAQNEKLSGLYEDQAAALSTYNEAYEKYAELQKAESDARKAFTDRYGVDPTSTDAYPYLNSELGEAWGHASQNLQEYNGELQDAEDNLNNVNSRIDEVNETIGNQEAALSGAYEGIQEFVMFSPALNDAFDSDADVLTDFSEALEDAGLSVDYLSNLSDPDLINLAHTWETNGGNIIDIINDLGIATDDMYASVQDMVKGFSSGEVSSSLEGMGISVDDLAQRISDAGITMEQLNAIGSDNFAELVANCGGDIDKLIWQIQNYNDTPILDKDGNVSVDQVELMDAQGNLYTWNGTELLDKDGNAVVDDIDLVDAQNNKVHWNGTDLKDLDASVTVYDNGFTSMFEMVSKWNKTKLNDLKATLSVTQYQKTVKTVETQTVGQAPKSAPMSLYSQPVAMPMSLSADSAAPSMRVASNGLTATANALSVDPKAMSTVATEVVDGVMVSSSTSSRGNSNGGSTTVIDNDDVVKAINELRDDISKMGVYIDKGKLVGGISKDMNRSLGRIKRRESLS